MATLEDRGLGLAFPEHSLSRDWEVVVSARSVDTADEVLYARFAVCIELRCSIRLAPLWRCKN